MLRWLDHSRILSYDASNAALIDSKAMTEEPEITDSIEAAARNPVKHRSHLSQGNLPNLGQLKGRKIPVMIIGPKLLQRRICSHQLDVRSLVRMDVAAHPPRLSLAPRSNRGSSPHPSFTEVLLFS